MIPPLVELLRASSDEKLALASGLARSLGRAWTASDVLVGEAQMIELVHSSGHRFVAIGSASYTCGLRHDERDALVTAMMGPGEEDKDRDEAAERSFAESQLPRELLEPALVEVPAFLIGREPLSLARASALGGVFDDLGYPEAAATNDQWRAFVETLPDGIALPTEEQWELVAREGGAGSWIVPIPANGFPGMWPPNEVFALENAFGVRSLAIGEVFANGFRRGVGDGRGNWGGPTGNAELHVAIRWRDCYGASRLARSL